MSQDPELPEEEPSRKFKLVWKDNQELETVYVNEMLITHVGTEFYIIFGELVPPLIINLEEVATLPDHIEIHPRVRIAISYQAMQKITDAINENFSKFLARSNNLEGSDEE